MSPVLLDAGPIVALMDEAERNHRQCVESIVELQLPLVTCEAAIAEACYLLRNLKGASESVLANVERGNFLIPYSVTGRAGRLAKLIKKYRNVPMDFADACLVDMASELGTGRILTLDRDFRVYRWSRNRPFEFLLEPL